MMSMKTDRTKKQLRYYVSMLIVFHMGIAAWIFVNVKHALPFWGDEWFTYKVSVIPMNVAIMTVLRDAHPPLYWIIINAFQSCLYHFNKTSDDILALRHVSIIFGITAIYICSLIFNRYVKSESDKKYSQLVFLLIALTSPFMLLFFPMARYYSLFALLVSISLLIKSKEKLTKLNVAGIIIVDTLMLYTNFLAGLVLIGSWIYLLTRKIEKPSRTQLTWMLITPLILFAPIMPSLFSALTKISGQNFFTADFGTGLQGFIVRIVYTWHVFFSGEFIYPWQVSGIFMFLLAGYMAFRFIKYASPEFKRLIGYSIALPFLLVIISSISLFSLGMEFVPPRLAFAQIFFVIAITLGIFTIENRKLRWGIIILILLCNIHADYKFFKRENFLHSTYIIPYDQIARDINNEPKSSRTTFLLFDEEAALFSFFHKNRLNDVETFNMFNISHERFSLDKFIDARPDAQIWLVYSAKDRTPDQKLSSILERLTQSDYAIVEHFKYVEESESALKMKKMLLRRNVEKYKKEAILFEPTSE